MRKQVLQCSAHFCGHATETLRSIQVPTEGAAIHPPLLPADGQGMQTGCCGSSVCQDPKLLPRCWTADSPAGVHAVGHWMSYCCLQTQEQFKSSSTDTLSSAVCRRELPSTQKIIVFAYVGLEFEQACFILETLYHSLKAWRRAWFMISLCHVARMHRRPSKGEALSLLLVKLQSCIRNEAVIWASILSGNNYAAWTKPWKPAVHK